MLTPRSILEVEKKHTLHNLKREIYILHKEDVTQSYYIDYTTTSIEQITTLWDHSSLLVLTLWVTLCSCTSKRPKDTILCINRITWWLAFSLWWLEHVVLKKISSSSVYIDHVKNKCERKKNISTQ